MSGTPLLPTLSSRRTRQRRGGRVDCQEVIRLVLPASVIAAFLLFVLTASIIHETGHSDLSLNKPDVVFPDFSHYKLLQTLPPAHFPIRSDDNKRIIAIGDIHGMNNSLSTLLTQISYDPRLDTFIHLGDLVPKSTEVPVDRVLNFLSANHILGVRGNNDEKVIEWKAWRDWIVSLPGGRDWLEDMDSHWSHIDGDEPNPKFDAWLKKSHRKWKAYVPSGWKLHGKHYKFARDLSREHYKYLRSLPLILYAPTAHTYFVHAGLLPADPTRKSSDPKQPLSHWPTTAHPGEDYPVLRGLQELALLNDVPQNQDPWVLMNMRSLTDDGKVESDQEGKPWSELWNDVMDKCSGWPTTTSSISFLSEHGSTRMSLHCFPSMVVYGHAAARGLDVKRWSVGLDTGCVYNRRLTAVVLDADSLTPKTYSAAFASPLGDSPIQYGDEGTARIVSVKCDDAVDP